MKRSRLGDSSGGSASIGRPCSTGVRVVVGAGRALSAVSLLAMGGSHLVLWLVAYAGIPVIASSFLLNAIGGLVLAVAVLAVRLRYLPVAALLGAVFTAGTLGALGLALTVGLFGFVDAITTPLVPTTLAVEAAGVVVLAATAVIATRVRRSG